MPLYRVAFRGGGGPPQRFTNREQMVQASSPHVALSRVVANAEKDGMRLPVGSWANITISRIGDGHARREVS